MGINAALKGATAGSDLFLGVCKLQEVSVESTLSTVRKDHVTTALLVNTSGGPLLPRMEFM